jgi:hypothetical protein
MNNIVIEEVKPKIRAPIPKRMLLRIITNFRPNLSETGPESRLPNVAANRAIDTTAPVSAVEILGQSL